MKSVSIIGVGRLGGALAIALSKNGYEIKNLFVRNPENFNRLVEGISPVPRISGLQDVEKISSDIILITTQDAEIENVVAELTNKIASNQAVFHTSGALSSKILRQLKQKGSLVGSFHPLVSISDPIIGAGRFKNTYFCIEGDAKAVELGRKIAEDLQGKPFSIETKYKTLYHASAVASCGHLVALIDVALEMMTKCGLDFETAKQILLPLIKSTIDNLENQTTAEALTGTFARADVKTFENHLDSVKGSISVEAQQIYLLLGERSTDLAEMSGANLENLQKIRDKILLAKKDFKC
jgi:predicted short-subunit dehydrogenase-like oxidoreductase (DUF2520 family)